MEDTIAGLPKAIINSDDELMGIAITYDEDEKVWYITYADEGSSISAKGKTFKEAEKAIRKECIKVYGSSLEENS